MRSLPKSPFPRDGAPSAIDAADRRKPRSFADDAARLTAIASRAVDRRRGTFLQRLWSYVRYKSWTRRFADYLWRFKLTSAGKWIAVAWFISGIGAVSVQLAIYQVFCALAALAGVAWSFGHFFRPKLTVEGRFPERLVAGERIRTTLTVANRGVRDAEAVGLITRDLGAAVLPLEVDPHLLTVGAGRSVSFPLSMQPTRRGLCAIPDVIAFTAFPFDVVRTAAGRLAGSHVLVLPSFHRLGKFRLPTGQRYQPGGVLLSSHVGECPEYVGNREYVPGEPVRRLDFRAWARLGTPVIREYQEEYFSRVALILDTHVAPRRRTRAQSREAFEAAVGLTAAIADALSIGEHVIDLFAAGPELYVFRAGRHTAHFDNVLELLAYVDVCSSNPFDVIAPAVADELTKISAAVCVLLDWDDSRRRFVRTIAESGCPTKVILVRSGTIRDSIDPDESVEFVEVTPEQINQGGIPSL